MLRVRIRIDKEETGKSIKIDGYSTDYPALHKEFSVEFKRGRDTVIIDLGTVLNIKPYGDMLLIRTTLAVAEVWILGGEREPNALAEVLPFSQQNSLLVKDGKITTLFRAGASRKSYPSMGGTLIKIRNLMKELHKLSSSSSAPLMPRLTLVKEVRTNGKNFNGANASVE